MKLVRAIFAAIHPLFPSYVTKGAKLDSILYANAMDTNAKAHTAHDPVTINREYYSMHIFICTIIGDQTGHTLIHSVTNQLQCSSNILSLMQSFVNPNIQIHSV